MPTSAVQKHIAQWSPSVLLLTITAYLSTAFLEFKGEVMVGLTELRAQAKQQTVDIAELRRRSDSSMTRSEVLDLIELQLLKHLDKK